jgi:hypothetical protein
LKLFKSFEFWRTHSMGEAAVFECLAALLNPDNNIRRQAEDILAALAQNEGRAHYFYTLLFLHAPHHTSTRPRNVPHMDDQVSAFVCFKLVETLNFRSTHDR